MVEVGAAFSSLKATFELVRLAIDAGNDAKIRAAVSDMAARFSDAQTATLMLGEQARMLSSKLADAEAEVHQLKRRLAEREQYVLHDLSGGEHKFAFRYAGPQHLDGQAVPMHYLCQLCFDAGKKSVLRKGERWGAEEWTCALDEAHTLTV